MLGDEKENEENLSGFSTSKTAGGSDQWVRTLKRMTSAYRNLCLPPKCWQSTHWGNWQDIQEVNALRSFITGWYLSYISADNARVVPESGPQERLSLTGDNLPNVIQYLREQHPSRLERILKILSQRVPRLEEVKAEATIDGRLVLQIRTPHSKTPFWRNMLPTAPSKCCPISQCCMTLTHRN